ncbi:sensor histidine kinase [Oceanicaulis sp. LC35]|uniref:sensor histidine kinase n=1 Tax=Oceanicaulis sp. LC35 TaxID=3349635 RepID=UPI003F861940
MHRKKVFATALASLIAITAVDIWLSNQIRQEQSALLETVSTARHETSQLHDDMGFGGLIHNFKNYVIRGDAVYFDTSRERAHALQIRIERLQSLSAELGLQADLSAVRDTITAYSDRLDTVRRGWLADQPIAEIDALVRVDDQPALDQIATLESQIDVVTRDGMNRLNRLSTIQSVMAPMLQALMLALIILMWTRVYRTRAKAAQEAQAQVANLDASLRAQSLTLERMRESNTALENFTSMVAHDLKAPLRQATMLLHLARRAASDEDKDATLTQVRDRIEHANSLVESFLNLAQLNDQPPETSLEDMTAIFHEAVDELAILYRKAPRHIQIDPLGMAFCDRELIRQVAINLLTNALKYAKAGTTLQIRVYALRDESMLTVYVEDNGVGIPPELAEHVFSPMVQGKNAGATKNKGRGLGLALCQTIIAAHGGDIRVSPVKGAGTRIRFTLPLAQPEPSVI